MIINLQMQERNKITLLSKEIRSRENILKQLQSRLEEIDKNHEEWKLRHKTSNEIEMKYHHNLLEKEKKYLSDLLLIEEEISETKIKTLNLLEDNMKNEVKMMDDMYKQQEEYLIENEKLLKEKIDMNYTLYKQRELSEKIEMNTNEKLRQLRMKRTREDVSFPFYSIIFLLFLISPLLPVLLPLLLLLSPRPFFFPLPSL